jgi:hypothetical protein
MNPKVYAVLVRGAPGSGLRLAARLVAPLSEIASSEGFVPGFELTGSSFWKIEILW